MRTQHGQTIIELLLAMGLALILFPALFTMFFLSREGKAQQIERTRAVGLVTEATEAIRSVRARGWEVFAQFGDDIPYHPIVDNNVWTLVNGAETTEGFTRSIIFSSVYRDASGTVVSTGGTPDLSTRKVTITVGWTSPLPTSIISIVYLTRHSNILEVDTTETDFLSGTQSNTKVVNMSGGEVILSSTGGYGDWCNPSLTINAVNLPKSGVANAVNAIAGQIAAGTGDNASGVSYANVLITDPSYPDQPTATISGTFDGYKTNDVFTEQQYAYLATDTNTKEVEIIDLRQTDGNGKYAEAGYFNAPGNGNASAVATTGDTGYMLGGTNFYSFNLTQKNGSRPIMDPDGVLLPGAGVKFKIRDSRAFIVTGSINAQLVVVDISDASNLTVVSQIALPGGAGTGIYVNNSGTRAYVTTTSSSTQRELFIVNVEAGSPTYGQVMGSYDTNGMNPTGVVVVSGPRMIVVGKNAEEYQVVDITSESEDPLPRCGGLNVDSGINGIDTVFTSQERAYSYIITGDATTELKIIEGGPGSSGHDYVLNGAFTSQIFDVSVVSSGSSEAAFNRIVATITKPTVQTDVSIQFAAADPIGGSCTNAIYTYVGPDGTANTAFSSTDGTTISGELPFSYDGVGFENPARCFRYRAQLLTADNALTPILSDVTISMSP